MSPQKSLPFSETFCFLKKVVDGKGVWDFPIGVAHIISIGTNYPIIFASLAVVLSKLQELAGLGVECLRLG